MTTPPTSCLPRVFYSAFAFLFFLIVAPARGADAADGQIKAAIADIEKYERQFAGQTSANAATVSRTLKLLALTRERLDSSPNKSHASWIDADTRLKALVSRLQSLGGASPAPAAPSAPPTATSAPRPAAPAPQMISQDRVRIKKLIRDIASAIDTLDRGGAKPFQDADFVATQVRVAGNFKASLDAYSDFSGDADVIEAAAALAKFESMIAQGREQAAKLGASLGDVQARLRAMDGALPRIPSAPAQPYEGEAVRTWIAALAKVRQVAGENIQQLALIRAGAFLPNNPGTVGQGAPYDMQDVERLEHWNRNSAREADEAVAQVAANLDAQVASIANTLDFLNRLDPANVNDQANAFLGAGKSAEQRKRLTEAKLLATVAVDFDKQQSREQLAAHQAMLEKIVAAAANYEANLAKARELVRVPKAASTDKTLLATATETLKNPQYGVGTIRRMVVNADKVHREKKTSEARFDKIDVMGSTVTLTGTETTYTYAWDQFQVATVEPADGTFFIYYNTLKYFSSGGPTTPLNRWILADRFQGSEIPEANIDRN